jgi:hypothetical protein
MFINVDIYVQDGGRAEPGGGGHCGGAGGPGVSARPAQVLRQPGQPGLAHQAINPVPKA